jgi:hypothetical protein
MPTPTRLEVLLKMYDEHTSHAKLHEEQREKMTNYLFLASGVIVTFITTSKFAFYTMPASAVLTAIGIYGLFFSLKHYERNRHHIYIAKAFRDEISRELDPATAGKSSRSLADIVREGRNDNEAEFQLRGSDRVEYGLQLIPAITRDGEIPAVGKRMVLVASVNGNLHFRAFDRRGRKVLDDTEAVLKPDRKGSERLRELKERLRGLWPNPQSDFPPPRLTWVEKNRILMDIEALFGRIKGMRTVPVVDVSDPIGQFVLRTRLYWFWAALPSLLTLFGILFLILPFTPVNVDSSDKPMKVELVGPGPKESDSG